MTTRTPNTRRDPRYRLSPELSEVRFVHRDTPGILQSGVLVSVSVSGLAFRFEADTPGFPVGTEIVGMAVRVRDCAFEGTAIVRNSRPAQAGYIEVGCLFYPDAREEDRWLTFIAGVDVGSEASKVPAP